MSRTLRGERNRNQNQHHHQHHHADAPLWFLLRFNQIAHTRDTIDTDGINSLTYRVTKVEKLDLFTKITVDVGKP